MVFLKQSSEDFLSTLDILTSNLLVEDLVRFNPRILIQAEWKLTVFFPWGNFGKLRPLNINFKLPLPTINTEVPQVPWDDTLKEELFAPFIGISWLIWLILNDLNNYFNIILHIEFRDLSPFSLSPNL